MCTCSQFQHPNQPTNPNAISILCSLTTVFDSIQEWNHKIQRHHKPHRQTVRSIKKARKTRYVTSESRTAAHEAHNKMSNQHPTPERILVCTSQLTWKSRPDRRSHYLVLTGSLHTWWEPWWCRTDRWTTTERSWPISNAHPARNSADIKTSSFYPPSSFIHEQNAMHTILTFHHSKLLVTTPTP